MVSEQTPANSSERTYSPWPPRWIILVLGLLLVFISIGYIRSFFQEGAKPAAELQTDTTYELSENRTKLPTFNITDKENRAVSLTAYKGKVVLLSFWASWCEPCVTELPIFSQLKEKYGANGFDVVTVNVDSDNEEASKFIKDFWPLKKLNFETFYDPKKEGIQALKIEILPSNYILDRKGQIALTGLGMDDWESPEVISSLENLLAE